MELNTFSEIWSEFKESYSKHSSLVRGLDAVALFAFLTVGVQVAYAAMSNGYPFQSLISSVCASLGLLVLVVAFRLHLTPTIGSTVSNARAFVDFLLSLTLLFWFVWNIMI
jgi:hypothetical protein